MRLYLQAQFSCICHLPLTINLPGECCVLFYGAPRFVGIFTTTPTGYYVHVNIVLLYFWHTRIALYPTVRVFILSSQTMFTKSTPTESVFNISDIYQVLMNNSKCHPFTVEYFYQLWLKVFEESSFKTQYLRKCEIEKIAKICFTAFSCN